MRSLLSFFCLWRLSIIDFLLLALALSGCSVGGNYGYDADMAAAPSLAVPRTSRSSTPQVQMPPPSNPPIIAPTR
jgi:hypothetical protein